MGKEGHLHLEVGRCLKMTSRSDKVWQHAVAARSNRQFVLCIPSVKLFLLHYAQELVVSVSLQYVL